MAYDIGPKIGIEGEPEFRKAITQINQTVKTLGTEMAAATSAYDKNDKSAENLTSQNKILNKQIEAQRDKLEKVKEMLAASAKETGENSTQTQKWQAVVNTATADLNKMERQLRENNEALKGQAISLDDVKESLSKIGAGISSALSTAAKVGGAAIAAASAGIVALTKSAIDGYSEYEQLVGGVETLFKSSADAVAGYAENAYKTAGLSANEYMSTVTSFSASLLQGLGGDTEEAARLADQAITDMSDNANKMGTDISMIQNAYQGFAKQNYTMLDNLKLGYGGTPAELARLINDSGVLGDAMTVTAETVNQVSFDKIIEAIGVVQDRMGITGTTAKEASSTIQGSISSMKSAWENFITGMAAPSQDFDTLVENLVDSVVTVGENLIPRIKMLLPRLTEGITQLAQSILPHIPETMQSLLPAVVEGATGLIKGAVELIPGLITSAMETVPNLAEAARKTIQSIGSSLSEAAPELITQGAEVLNFIYEGILSGLPKLTDAAVTIMGNLGQYLQENLPSLLQAGLSAVVELTGSIRENAGLLVDGALSLAKSLAQGLADGIPAIIENVPTIVSNIANTINDNAPKVLKAAVDIIGTLVKGLISAIPKIVENMPKIIAAIWDTITAVNWLNLGSKIITGLGNGIKNMASFAKESIASIKDTIVQHIKDLPKTMLNIGKNMIQGLINGIKSMASAVKDNIVSAANNAVHGVMDFLGINSPSKVFAGIGGYMAEGLAVGFGKEMPDVQRRIDRSMADLVDYSAGEAEAPAGTPYGPRQGPYSQADMVAAFREAMSGMAVYMNGRKVGNMVTTQQGRDARAAGGYAVMPV